MQGTWRKLTGTCASDDDGATAVEYAIMASLIAAVIVGVVGLLATGVVDLFTRVPAF